MRKITFVAILACCLSSLGFATNINGSSTGLTSPQNTVTFSEVILSNGQPITSYAGLTFAPGAYWDPEPGFFPDPSAGNFSFCCGGEIDPVTLGFPGVVNAAAFQFITNSGDDTTFTAMLGGSPVASFTAATAINYLWYGFQNINFDSINISVATNVNGAFLMDNVQYNSTPEPGTIALLGSGLLGIAGVLRRKANL